MLHWQARSTYLRQHGQHGASVKSHPGSQSWAPPLSTLGSALPARTPARLPILPAGIRSGFCVLGARFWVLGSGSWILGPLVLSTGHGLACQLTLFLSFHSSPRLASPRLVSSPTIALSFNISSLAKTLDLVLDILVTTITN